MDMNESGVGKYFVDKGKPKAIDWQLFDEQWPIVSELSQTEKAGAAYRFFVR